MCSDTGIKQLKNIFFEIIYCYKCSNCKVTYYGQTFRQFYTRATEHVDISKLAGISSQQYLTIYCSVIAP